ncbi:transmembrane protein [Cystoisospora suis]|uniref:Transmembrane protein n=1 Tax=Cystoisospora suis TaxID=483139 RepID=A0A2C6KZC3_9APIC|nr:transmembrane protein [Cystoisospora suis]
MAEVINELHVAHRSGLRAWRWPISARQCWDSPKLSPSASRPLPQIWCIRMVCFLAFCTFPLLAALGSSSSGQWPESSPKSAILTPCSQQGSTKCIFSSARVERSLSASSAILPWKLVNPSVTSRSSNRHYIPDANSENSAFHRPNAASALRRDHEPVFYSEHGTVFRVNGSEGKSDLSGLSDSVAGTGASLLEQVPAQKSRVLPTARGSPQSSETEGDDGVSRISLQRSGPLSISSLGPTQGRTKTGYEEVTLQSTIASPRKQDSADSWLSTTSAVALMLLTAYLYFVVRVMVLCRCYCSSPHLRSQASNFCAAVAPARGDTETPLAGMCEPEWILRGWTGTTITALSGFGEPWGNVLQTAARLRQEKAMPAYQKSEDPCSRPACCSACGDNEKAPYEKTVFAEGAHLPLCHCGAALCWETVAVLTGNNVPDLLDTTPAPPSSPFTGSEQQRFWSPVQCFEPWGAEDRGQEPTDQQIIRLAATYMQDRTFVWWGAYFASSCIFILSVLMTLMQADRKLVPTKQSLLDVTLHLPSSWRVVAAVQWCSSVCLLYGLVSDYRHTANGCFQDKQRVRLNVAVGVLSILFLTLIFTGPSEVCSTRGFRAAHTSETQSVSSPDNSVPLQVTSGETTPNERSGQAPAAHREFSDGETVLDPYIHAARRFTTVAEFGGGNQSSDKGSSCGGLAWWFGAAVTCYVCIRLIGVGLILSVVTNEYSFIEKKDSQAAISFSWLVAGLAFSFLDIFPFPVLRPLLREGSPAKPLLFTGVDVLLLAQCLCNFFFFKHVHRELLYATRPSIKDAIRAMQDTFRLKNFD